MTEELIDTALVPLPPAGGEIALPDALIERAKDYAKESLSPRTREAYGRWWRVFFAWCEKHGRQALPASPETIAAWLTALADGTDTGRPLARASINQALAAVTLAHRNAGYAFDRKHRVISMTWSGISRVKAMVEIERQAAPFLAADVRDLLAILKVERNIGCRNAALLTLGFGAALRRVRTCRARLAGAGHRDRASCASTSGASWSRWCGRRAAKTRPKPW